MMTASEILNEIRKLPLPERTKLKEKILRGNESNGTTKSQKKAAIKEILREMLSEGMISRIPEGVTNDEDDFKPVKINGRPISETILEDRD